MSFGGWGNDLDLDSDDEQAQEFYKSSGQALIMIISCSPDMFRPWGSSDEHAFYAAIKACYTTLRTKIISSPKDKVGILFMGTENAKNSSDFPNLWVFQELSNVKKQAIAQLMEMIKDPITLDGFQDKIGSSTNYDLKDTFWLTKIMFDDGEAKNMSKKIMLFTTEDNPHGNDPKLQDVVVQKFKDLGNVEFNIVQFRNDFDYTRFYSKLVEDESNVIKATDAEDLVRVMRIRHRLKRPYTKTMLDIAPGVKIGVGVYSFVRRAYKPKQVKIHLDTNEVVNKTVNTFYREDARPVLKSAQRKEIRVGGETVSFQLSELKELQYSFETGITLIGFLDKNQLPSFTWYRSAGYFLYPDEDKVTGSKELFASLLKRCDALQKIALVRFAMTRGQSPKLGILLPSMGEETKHGPTFPQGFHLVIIPFSDEIRQQTGPDIEATPEMVSIMEKIVKKLTQKDFNVTSVHNPQLHHKWKEIESLALDLPAEEDENEEWSDFTIPNVSLMEERMGTIPRQLENEIAVSGLVTESSSTQASTSSRAPKKPKIEANFDMENEARHGRLNKLTCAVLADFLDKHNISYRPRPNKNELIEKINAFYRI